MITQTGLRLKLLIYCRNRPEAKSIAGMVGGEQYFDYGIITEHLRLKKALEAFPFDIIIFDADAPGLDLKDFFSGISNLRKRPLIIAGLSDDSLDVREFLCEEEVFYLASRPWCEDELSLAAGAGRRYLLQRVSISSKEFIGSFRGR